MKLYELGGTYFYVSNDYNVFAVERDGRLIDRVEADRSRRDVINKVYTYIYEGEDVVLDFSYNLLPSKMGYDYDFTLEYRGETATKTFHIQDEPHLSPSAPMT
jgi:oligopeptide transport system permease protein